jgi:hypothetical protein
LFPRQIEAELKPKAFGKVSNYCPKLIEAMLPDSYLLAIAIADASWTLPDKSRDFI